MMGFIFLFFWGGFKCTLTTSVAEMAVDMTVQTRSQSQTDYWSVSKGWTRRKKAHEARIYSEFRFTSGLVFPKRKGKSTFCFKGLIKVWD